MNRLEKLLDDWCYDHADCNLVAWRNADTRDPALTEQFIQYSLSVIKAIGDIPPVVGKRYFLTEDGRCFEVPAWARFYGGPDPLSDPTKGKVVRYQDIPK